MRLDLELNGEPVQVEVPGDALLLDVIRQLGLTGSKVGCGVGVCGACAVLVDDEPVSACIYLAGCARGRRVWTVEGVARRHPNVVDAFVEHEGVQCGACTSGQVVMAAALRLRGGKADEHAIRRFLAGNLCRCTGYRSIIDAVKAAVGS